MFHGPHHPFSFFGSEKKARSVHSSLRRRYGARASHAMLLELDPFAQRQVLTEAGEE